MPKNDMSKHRQKDPKGRSYLWFNADPCVTLFILVVLIDLFIGIIYFIRDKNISMLMELLPYVVACIELPVVASFREMHNEQKREEVEKEPDIFSVGDIKEGKGKETRLHSRG